MTRPLFIAAIVLVIIIGILLLRKASLEGKLILAFGALALGAFLRVPHYLLLLVSLSLFSFVGVALLWAWLASTRLRLVREVKDEAMVGESVPVTYRISTGSLLILFHVRIWDRVFRERPSSSPEEQTFETPGYIAILRIQRGESSEGILHFVPPVRGLFKFGPVAVEGGDPFGIFTLTKWLPIPDECLVLPAWVIMSGIPSIPAKLGAREQEHLISKEGHSHEFLGIRPYTESDGLRGVHWPLTAKHGTLIVRQFQREVEEEILIILDADRCGDIGEGAENPTEYLITLALSLASAGADIGRPWTLIVVAENVEIISHSSRAALLQAQHMLARLQAKRQSPIEDSLENIRRDFRDSGCILLTPRTDPAPAEALARGDARAGDGVRSLIVRVDPSTFVVSIDSGLAAMKRRRGSTEPVVPTARTPASSVGEILVSRGDNIGDLFLGRTFA